MSAFGKEETLYSQLVEIQSKLKTLAIKKRSEVNNSKQIKNTFKKKIESLKASLQKINDDYQIASGSQIEKQRIRENSTIAKARAYDESLGPLEIEAKELKNIKEKLFCKQTLMSQEIEILSNAYFMALEDMNES
jgi:hypothetical protein